MSKPISNLVRTHLLPAQQVKFKFWTHYFFQRLKKVLKDIFNEDNLNRLKRFTKICKKNESHDSENSGKGTEITYEKIKLNVVICLTSGVSNSKVFKGHIVKKCGLAGNKKKFIATKSKHTKRYWIFTP